MHAIVLQVVCVLVIIAAAAFFIRGSKGAYGKAKPWQIALAVENVAVPFSTIVNDFQAIDIPLNYAALFMRPVLFASLALAYRVWLDVHQPRRSTPCP